jgi:hypothetical protein
MPRPVGREGDLRLVHDRLRRRGHRHGPHGALAGGGRRCDQRAERGEGGDDARAAWEEDTQGALPTLGVGADRRVVPEPAGLLEPGERLAGGRRSAARTYQIAGRAADVRAAT